MRTRWYRWAGVVLGLALVLGCAAPVPPTASPGKPSTAPVPVATVGPGATTAAGPAATSTPAATAAPKVKRGGTLRQATASIVAMDPIMSNQFGQAQIRMLFDSLFRNVLVDDKTGQHELRGELAETWKLDDPKTYTIRLRRGVKFHDGSPLDAETVRYSIDRMINHKKSVAKSFVQSIDSVEVVDPSTIRLKLKEPNAGLLINLAGTISAVGIVPKAAVERLGDDGFNDAPVGTGPMQFVEWKRDDRVILKKFDGYWERGVDGQPLPYLDQLIIRFISDPSVSLVEMKAGTIDLMTESEPRIAAEAKKNPDLVYWPHPTAPSTKHFGFSPYVGAFAKNPKLRQAAIHALDRGALDRTINFGIGKILRYPYWPEGYLGYDDSIPYYNYDLAKSKQLMSEAGFPAGLDVSFTVISRPVDQQIAQIMQQMWGQVGIRAQLDVMERQAGLARMTNRNAEISMWGGEVGADPDQNTRNLGSDATGNWNGWNDPRIDKLLLDGRSTYDPKERAAIYRQLQVIIYEEAFTFGLNYLPWSIIHQKYVKGTTSQWRTIDHRHVWLDR